RAPDCPVEPDACDFVRRVVDALASNDPAALLPRLAPEEAVCPEPGSGGLGGPFPLCDGAAAGETRWGVPISRINSEGGMIRPEDVAREVMPDFNGPRPGTIGCAETDPADGPSCRDVVSLVFVP